MSFKQFNITVGSGKHVLEAVVAAIGRDLAVAFGGGELYHIGAGALAVPHENPKKGASSSAFASASVICVTGHREDQLARKAALQLAAELGCSVNVVFGAHIDNAGQEDIRQIEDNFNRCLDMIVEKVGELF